MTGTADRVAPADGGRVSGSGNEGLDAGRAPRGPSRPPGRSRRRLLAVLWGIAGLLVVVLISFFSCALSLQAAASRLVYSYARDHMMPASNLLSRFSVARAVPPYALLLAAVVPAVIILGFTSCATFASAS